MCESSAGDFQFGISFFSISCGSSSYSSYVKLNNDAGNGAVDPGIVVFILRS